MSEPDINLALENKKNSFLSTLKQATAKNHLLLESNTLLSSLLTSRITLHQYYYYLKLMYHVHFEYEQLLLVHTGRIFPGWGERRSSPVINDDLKSLQYIPSKTAVTNYQLPSSSSLTGQALGFMYVIEGSRLGGRVIYKNIQQRLGFSENNGAKFISDNGYETALHWKKFCSRFSSYVIDQGAEEETTRNAANAFASIYDYFELNRQVYEI